MNANMERDVLSLCGDKLFRVSRIPRGVTEKKIQRILDARLPQAFVELWWVKRKKEMVGRISVPKEIVSASIELKQVLSKDEGCLMFLGPIKVHLREEKLRKREQSVKTKVKNLEEKQNEMKSLLGRLTSMVENKMRLDEHVPMPSPGRDGEFISQRKRAAPANIVRKEQKKIRVLKISNEKKKEEKREISDENFDPEISSLRSAIREAERDIRQQLGPNKEMLQQLLRMRTGFLNDNG